MDLPLMGDVQGDDIYMKLFSINAEFLFSIDCFLHTRFQ